MFEIRKNGDIHMVRGDTGYFSLALVNPGTRVLYSMVSGDSVTFKVKESALSTSAVITKSITNQDGQGKCLFQITPSETAALDYGRYLYDIQLTHANGDVDTVVPHRLFCIEEEVC